MLLAGEPIGEGVVPYPWGLRLRQRTYNLIGSTNPRLSHLLGHIQDADAI